MTSRFPHAASRRLGGFKAARFSIATFSGVLGPLQRCAQFVLSARVLEKINRKPELLEILQLIENKGTCQKSIGNFPDSALHKAGLPATIERSALPFLSGSTTSQDCFSFVGSPCEHFAPMSFATYSLGIAKAENYGR
jgi:hypothetical protein